MRRENLVTCDDASNASSGKCAAVSPCDGSELRGLGTYAIRLLRKSTYRRGKGQAEINPLRIIVEKMKKQLAGGRMRAVYEANLVEDTDYLELPIYDTECDARGTR